MLLRGASTLREILKKYMRGTWGKDHLHGHISSRLCVVSHLMQFFMFPKHPYIGYFVFTCASFLYVYPRFFKMYPLSDGLCILLGKFFDTYFGVMKWFKKHIHFFEQLFSSLVAQKGPLNRMCMLLCWCEKTVLCAYMCYVVLIKYGLIHTHFLRTYLSRNIYQLYKSPTKILKSPKSLSRSQSHY